MIGSINRNQTINLFLLQIPIILYFGCLRRVTFLCYLGQTQVNRESTLELNINLEQQISTESHWSRARFACTSNRPTSSPKLSTREKGLIKLRRLSGAAGALRTFPCTLGVRPARALSANRRPNRTYMHSSSRLAANSNKSN
jgi:hypothetical protein